MIKFKMTDKDGKVLIGLGLTDQNMKLLRESKPISIDGEKLEIEYDIFIFHGTDEQAIIDQMKNVGLINPKTRYT